MPPWSRASLMTLSRLSSNCRRTSSNSEAFQGERPLGFQYLTTARRGDQRSDVARASVKQISRRIVRG